MNTFSPESSFENHLLKTKVCPYESERLKSDEPADIQQVSTSPGEIHSTKVYQFLASAPIEISDF